MSRTSKPSGMAGFRLVDRIRQACPKAEVPEDVMAELIVRFEDRLAVTTLADDDAVLEYFVTHEVQRRLPCYDPDYKGPCLDPTHCVVPGHAHEHRWSGQGYVPYWVEFLRQRIGLRREQQGNGDVVCRRITLSTGPAPGEDPRSLEDMVNCADLFRPPRFRWDHFFCRLSHGHPHQTKNQPKMRVPGAGVRITTYKDFPAIHHKAYPRDSRDSRIIPAMPHEFLLEARIRLLPPNHKYGWRVSYEYLYCGPPLDEDASKRRWLKHPRNRGRKPMAKVSGVAPNPHNALYRMQLYRVRCLDLPGPERAHLRRLHHGMRRVFRLGAGRGKVKVAKRLWKQSLADTDHQMLAAPVSKASWAKAVVGAASWEQAMKRLKGDDHQDDRTAARRWRWSQRRKLYRESLEHVMKAVSLSPDSFVQQQPEEQQPEPQASHVPVMEAPATVNVNVKMSEGEVEQMAEQVANRVRAKLATVLAQLPNQVAERVRQIFAEDDDDARKRKRKKRDWVN